MVPATEASVEKLRGVPEILALEEQQERRVADALAAFAEKEDTTRRAYADEERAFIAKAEEEAEAEIAAYRETEARNILVRGEQECAGHLASIASAYKKHSPAVRASLVARVLDEAFLKETV